VFLIRKFLFLFENFQKKWPGAGYSKKDIRAAAALFKKYEKN
jgi:hypothetical protein